ncbi:MAG: hypothetical protein PHR41_09035 [Lactococcus chungangensis]|nr:hypothetical protein [Lactococcus chungangensis]
MRNHIGQKVIIRSDKAGVFYGVLTEKEGSEVTLSDCRRLWYWSGAASLSQLAKEGVKKASDCKFSVTVEEMQVLGVIEIIPCANKAIKNIESVPEWKN